MLEKLGGKKVLMIVEDALDQAFPRMIAAENAIAALPEAERASYIVHHVETKKEALDTLAGQRRGGYKVIAALLDNDFPHVPGESLKHDSGAGIIAQMTFANDRTPVMLNSARLDQGAVGVLAKAAKVAEPSLAEGQQKIQIGDITVADKLSTTIFKDIGNFFADAIERAKGISGHGATL